MERQPELPNIPAPPPKPAKREKRPVRKQSFLKHHWFASLLAVVVIAWEIGFNLAFQKGYLDDMSDDAAFYLLAGPIGGFLLLAVFHPEVVRRYAWMRRNKLWACLIAVSCAIAVACTITALHRLTHPKPAAPFELSINFNAATNGATIHLGDNRQLVISVRNKTGKAVPAILTQFTPSIDAKYFSFPQHWQLVGDADWIGDGPTRKVNVWGVRWHYETGNEISCKLPPITVASNVIALRCDLEAYATGTRSTKVNVQLNFNPTH